MFRMSHSSNVYDAMASEQAGRKNLVDWANSHPDQFEIAVKVHRLRMQQNG